MSNDTQALQIVPKHALTTLVFGSSNPIQALEAVGGIAAKSGAFGFGTTQAGAVAIITCVETGITLTEYHRTYDTVEGKPRKKAMAALVEFEKSGGKFEWILTGDEPAANPDDRKATLHLERGAKKRDYTYSMKDAAAEGLVKPGSRWVKRPGNMLRARCITNGLGLIAPEIFAGEYDEESEAVTPPLLVEKTTEKPAKVESVSTAPEPARPVTQETTPPTQAQAAVIDVDFKTSPQEDAKAEAAAGLAPAIKFGPADVRGDPLTGRLDEPTVIAIEAAIGEHAIAVVTWLKAKKWITNDLPELSVERARRILEKPEVLINYAKGGAK